jgi:hypothetical protein
MSSDHNNSIVTPSDAMISLHIEPIDTSSGLGVPYRPSMASGGMTQYFDTKRNPACIPKIREIRNKKFLICFLQNLNSSTSLFRSLRCERYCECESELDGFKRKAHWNFTFAFEIVEFNYSGHHEFQNVFEKYLATLPASARVHYELEIIQTSYNDHHITRSFSQDLIIYGYGQSEREAKDAFLRGLKDVGNLFARESTTWSNQLRLGLPTIS